MQIHELPATTTFDDSTVLPIENSSGNAYVTSKLTGASLKSALTSDTGWTAMTLTSSVSGGLAYRVLNGVLYIVGTGLNVSSTATSVTAATLPSGSRPSVRWTVKPSFPNYSNNTYINITTNGTIDIINNTGAYITNLYFTTAVPI